MDIRVVYVKNEYPILDEFGERVFDHSWVVMLNDTVAYRSLTKMEAVHCSRLMGRQRWVVGDPSRVVVYDIHGKPQSEWAYGGVSSV